MIRLRSRKRSGVRSVRPGGSSDSHQPALRDLAMQRRCARADTRRRRRCRGRRRSRRRRPARRGARAASIPSAMPLTTHAPARAPAQSRASRVVLIARRPYCPSARRVLQTIGDNAAVVSSSRCDAVRRLPPAAVACRRTRADRGSSARAEYVAVVTLRLGDDRAARHRARVVREARRVVSSTRRLLHARAGATTTRRGAGPARCGRRR